MSWNGYCIILRCCYLLRTSFFTLYFLTLLKHFYPPSLQSRPKLLGAVGLLQSICSALSEYLLSTCWAFAQHVMSICSVPAEHLLSTYIEFAQHLEPLGSCRAFAQHLLRKCSARKKSRDFFLYFLTLFTYFYTPLCNHASKFFETFGSRNLEFHVPKTNIWGYGSQKQVVSLVLIFLSCF